MPRRAARKSEQPLLDTVAEACNQHLWARQLWQTRHLREVAGQGVKFQRIGIVREETEARREQRSRRGTVNDSVRTSEPLEDPPRDGCVGACWTEIDGLDRGASFALRTKEQKVAVRHHEQLREPLLGTGERSPGCQASAAARPRGGSTPPPTALLGESHQRSATSIHTRCGPSTGAVRTTTRTRASARCRRRQARGSRRRLRGSR